MQLIILAAGKSKRFGRPKQLEEIYENKTIIDYNIENALKNEIKDIIIVTNKKLEKQMKEKYSSKAKIIISNFKDNKQQIGNLYTLYSILKDIKDDFTTINADDYYEKNVFKKAQKFLKKSNENLGVIAYKLKNVLSNNGPVNRGIIIKRKDILLKIAETTGIEKTNNIIKDKNNNILKNNLPVAMGLHIFRKSTKKYIRDYVEEAIKNKEYLKKELRLTEFISSIKDKYKIKVIKTNAKWIGITFEEDKKDAYEFFKNKC